MADAAEAIRKAQAAGEAAKQASTEVGTNGMKAGAPLPEIKVQTYAPRRSSSGGGSGSRVAAAAGRTADYLVKTQGQSMTGYTSGSASNVDYVDLARRSPNLYPNLAEANAKAAAGPESFWDKVKGVLASPLSAAARVLNVVSDAAYGTGAELLNPIASGISTGIAKATGDTRSAGQIYTDSFKTGLDTANKYYSGGRTSDIIINQVAPSYLEQHVGVSLGLSVAESLLDPTNYLSFGLGKGAVILDDAGKAIRLTEDASKFAKSLGKTIEEIRPEILNAIKYGTYIEKGSKSIDAANLVDKSAIRLGGKAIKGTERVMEMVQATKVATVQVMHEIPGFNKVADALSGAFVSSVDKLGHGRAVQIAKDFKAKVSSALARNDQLAYDLTKGLTKQEQELVLNQTTKIGREAVLAQLSDTGRAAAERIYKTLDALPAVEQAAKIPVEAIENYMPQRYADSYEDITKKLTDTKIRLMKMAKNGESMTPVQSELHQLFQAGGDLKRMEGQPYFVNDKFLKTKEMADEAGIATNGNLRDVLKSRLNASTEAISKNELAQTLDKEFAAPSYAKNERILNNLTATRDEIESGSKAHLFGENTVERTIDMNGIPTKVYIPEEMDKLISDTYGAIKADGSSLNVPSWLKKPLDVYDKTAQAWKGAVTAYFPNFYIRNAMDSTFRNIQDIGLWNTINPSGIRDAAAIARLSNAKNIEEMGDAIVKYGGKSYKLAELRKIMDDLGVTQSMRAAEGVSAVLRKGGDKIENFSRIQNFLMNLDRTGSIRTAAERSKRFQFDYSDLTPFERNVMQRFFPFYTFNRKNIEFQVSEFLSHPGPYKQLLQIRDSMDRNMQSPDEAKPDYIRDGYSIPLGKDENGNMRYLGGLGLSLEGADKTIGAVTSLAAGNTRPFEQNVVSSLNPALKSALEITSGRNFFTGTGFDDPRAADAKNQQAALYVMDKFAPNLVNFTKASRTNSKGNQVEVTTANPIAISIASSLPTSRATSVGSTAMRDDKSVSDVIGGLFSPAKVYTVSSDYAANQKYFDAQDAKKKSLQDFIQKGLVKQAASGKYYVDKTWKAANASETERLRGQALELLKR